MDDDCKLYYFNGKGRAEVARIMFAESGKKYEDVRLAGEKWAEFKERTPFGQLPVLEVNGEQIAQTSAINTFLAKKLGFYSNDLLESARIDMFTESLGDIVKHLPMFEKDAEVKAQKLTKAYGETYPVLLKKLENMLDKNCKDGFVTSKLTVADIGWMVTAHVLLAFDEKKTCLDNTPKLKALLKKVESLPNIAKWLKERPQTDF